MKKTLKLVFLAVAALALLTSCDAMLESLFPAETIGTGTGSNSVTFHVRGWDYYSGYISAYEGDWAGYYELYSGGPVQTIWVEVFDQNGVSKGVQSTTFDGTGGYGYERPTVSDVTFSGLTDGTYTFRVWYDLDGDGTSTYEGNYYYYYYVDYADVSGSSLSYLYMPYNGLTSATANVDLYEYPYWGY